MLKDFKRKEDGVMTLEAAMILPIMMAFILLMITMVQIVIAEIALQNAVSETAKVTSSYSYLLHKADTHVDSAIENIVDRTGDKVSGKTDSEVLTEIINAGKSKVTGELKEVIPAPTEGFDSYADDALYTALVKYYYKANVGNGSTFNAGGIMVEDAQSFANGGADVAVEASVKLNISLPFFEFKREIKKKAVERSWKGIE